MTSAAQIAFQHLKSKIVEAQVLKLPDFSQPFILKTDALGVGIGAVLSLNNILLHIFQRNSPLVCRSNLPMSDNYML